MPKLKPPTEKAIEKAVCDYATSKGVLVRKNDAIVFIGRPDRIFHWGGSTWYIEFKRHGGVLSAAQAREINRLIDKGIPVFVVSDIEHGKKVIDDMLTHNGEFYANCSET